MTTEGQLASLNTLLARFQNLVDTEEGLRQWREYHHILGSSQYKEANLGYFMKRYGYNTVDTYPEMTKLVVISLTIQVTSATCKHGISAYNYIKGDYRSSLRVTMMNHLMHLNLNAKEPEFFSFAAAFDHWVESRERTGLSAWK